MKKVLDVLSARQPEWVGNGFFSSTMFSYRGRERELSPFLVLGYAAPTSFTPADKQRGIGPHPHRGFETVSFVFQGELAHRDSAGNSGTIGAGDVQWMTAGAGILHEEFHSPAFTRSGGTLEMAQLWVNLPAGHKMSAPRYQPIQDSDIPSVRLADGAGLVRIIAGEFEGRTGPANTFSPIHAWDVRLVQGKRAELTLPDGWNTIVAVMQGKILINGVTAVHETQTAVLDRSGRTLSIDAESDAAILLLAGEPLEEPVVGRGLFVMNTEQELAQAVADFRSGAFGRL